MGLYSLIWNVISTAGRSKDRQCWKGLNGKAKSAGLLNRRGWRKHVMGVTRLSWSRRLAPQRSVGDSKSALFHVVVITGTPPRNRPCLQHCLLWHGVFALDTVFWHRHAHLHCSDGQWTLAPLPETTALVPGSGKGVCPLGVNEWIKSFPGWLYRCLLNTLEGNGFHMLKSTLAMFLFCREQRAEYWETGLFAEVHLITWFTPEDAASW